jgi:ubiquinone/menaquinone biosynthesis C-methylase UbiE
MAKKSQKEMWEALIQGVDLQSLRLNALNPDEFQLEIKECVDRYAKPGAKIIEVGCFSGVGSFILDESFDKTLLDLSSHGLSLAHQLFDSFGKTATFIQADMFDMPFPNSFFDVVFNAGVIEHFSFAERKKALVEYGRILKPDGVMIIAFPNHYSRPYRMAYRYLNWRGRWNYPKEEQIYDLSEELRETDLKVQLRSVTAKNTVFFYLNQIPFLGALLKPLFLVSSYEGYLSIITIKKKIQ